jgi:hypothetical protein
MGACALLALATPARAQVSATVSMTADRTSVAVGESFRLQIRADVHGAEIESLDPPDLSAFRIVSRHSATPMQFRFGFGTRPQTIQTSMVQDLVVQPLREGRVALAPATLRAGGQVFTSNALAIQVGAGTAPPDPGQLGVPTNPGVPPAGTLDGATYDDQAFLRTVVDKSSAYVGEQVTVTAYLYLRGAVRASPIIHREPLADGFWVHDLLTPNRTLDAQRQVVNGVPFNVFVLRRFAAFPLEAGNLTIGAMDVTIETGSVFDIFGTGGGGSLRREGVPVTIRVRELPAAGRPDGDIAVGRFELSARLDRTEVRTGDAVTLTAMVRGTGNVREVSLELPEIPGVRALAPEIRDEVSAPNDLVQGTRTLRWILVAEQPGEHRVPPLSLATFDPATESYQVLDTPPATLTAAGAPVAGADDDPEGADAPRERRQLEVGPLHRTSELERAAPAVSATATFWIALAFPPLVFFLFVLAGLVRRRVDARREANAPKHAVKRAKKRLATAEAHATGGDVSAFYGEIRRVLREVLEARLGEPVGGLTHTQLRSHLVSRGMDDDLSQRLVDELEGSEFARFSAAGASTAEIKSCTERVGALLERMDRFTPSAQPEAR